MSPEEFRRKVMDEGLDREGLDPDPFVQFEHWYRDAIDCGIFEPNAMSLATASADGHPSLRTVLLKYYDERGLVFFTNYDSRKAREIDTNSNVALMFPWVSLGRQVKITGTAAKLAMSESMKYFATRPRGSQIGAWASPQSQIITSRSLLEVQVDAMKRKFAEGHIPLPSFWGGYRVSPETIEFWQARENRLHDRFLYSRDEQGTWHIARLAP